MCLFTMLILKDVFVEVFFASLVCSTFCVFFFVVVVVLFAFLKQLLLFLLHL